MTTSPRLSYGVSSSVLLAPTPCATLEAEHLNQQAALTIRSLQGIKNSAAAKAKAKLMAIKQMSAAMDREAAKRAAEMRAMSLAAIASMNMERVKGMRAADFAAMSAKQVRSLQPRTNRRCIEIAGAELKSLVGHSGKAAPAAATLRTGHSPEQGSHPSP